MQAPPWPALWATGSSPNVSAWTPPAPPVRPPVQPLLPYSPLASYRPRNLRLIFSLRANGWPETAPKYRWQRLSLGLQCELQPHS